MLVWTALLMAWDGGASLAEQFASARACVTSMFSSVKRVGGTYQGFVKAMASQGALLLDRLATRLRAELLAMDGCWAVTGIVAFAVDGSRVECPRTAPNETQLKRAGRKKTGPQLSLTTLYHMGSGCVWDFRIGPGVESERTHLRQMIASLPPGATIVADAGFIGYDLLTEIISSGRHVLFRVGSNVTLLKGLGFAVVEGDSTVYLWPDKAQKGRQAPIVLRLMTAAGRHPVYMVSDVMEEQAMSFEQACTLYRLRWGIEVCYRSLKQTLGHRKMRSRAPDNAKMELQWAMAAMWVLSVRGVQEIVAAGKNPISLSIAMARKVIRQAMAGRCRPGTDLARELSKARKDTYVRQRPKTARNWPHKKTERPPGAPKTLIATTEQVHHAKELHNQTIAA
jgi:hypothetical protein